MDISILAVIPTLGSAATLSRTLDSVISRKYVTPLIVCPERSLKDVSEQFPSVQVVSEGTNKGLYGAINTAMTHSNAKWTHFTYLNDDDYWTKSFGAVISALEKAPQLDLIYGYCGYVNLSTGHRGIFGLEDRAARLCPLFLCGIIGILQPGTVVSRAMWEECGPYNTDLKLNADLDFILRVSQATRRTRVIKRQLAVFEISGQQLSTNQSLVEKENAQIRTTLGHYSRWLCEWYKWMYRLKNLTIYARRLLNGPLTIRGNYARARTK